ncbi:MAG: NCS2 family permease, partial [Vulcanimicrobiota bacterium]
MEFLNNYFKLKERESSVKIEIIAGVTTFLSMAYIIFVNPDILSATGMPKDALIIATCLASAFACLLVGFVAKVPIAMAPGMGLNAFFAFTLVQAGTVSWQTGLGIVFISGLVFFILSVTRVRERIVKAIPAPIIDATSVGIGIFIAFIGLKNLGIVVNDDTNLVTLGQFSTPVLIGIAGLLLIIILELFKVKGSILISIVATTVVGILLGKVSMPEKMVNLNFNYSRILLQLDIIGALKWGFLGSIFTLMFVDMFDSVGTLVACLKEAKLVKEDGTLKELGTLLTLDAVATMVGALLGTSTTTAYVESATGIEEGGRTGITAIVTGLLFLLAIVLLPIISIVPGFATAPALIVVGLFMMKGVRNVDFKDLEIAFPAFMTIMLMPL